MKHIAMIALAMGLASPARAQEKAPDRLLELESKIDVLSQEVERIKLGEAAAEPKADAKILGYAPAATKVYRAQQNKVSVGGYGEMVYKSVANNRQDGAASVVRDMADFQRAILYVGYKFNDWIVFNSELEFEHGTTGNGRGEVSLEQAYVDFRPRPQIGVRAGTVLVPMGLQNEIHEPPTFHGVKRTSVEQNVIPSTWRENGAGVFGDIGPVSYRSYLVSGLQSTTNTGGSGFNSSSGLRRGRSSGAKSYAEDFASVTR